MKLAAASLNFRGSQRCPVGAFSEQQGVASTRRLQQSPRARLLPCVQATLSSAGARPVRRCASAPARASLPAAALATPPSLAPPPRQPRASPATAAVTSATPGAGSAGSVAVVSSAGLLRGFPKQNQDSYVVEPVPALGQAATLIGVFDGHGQDGHRAAQSIAQQVVSAVHSCAEDALQQAMRQPCADGGSLSSGCSSDSELALPQGVRPVSNLSRSHSLEAASDFLGPAFAGGCSASTLVAAAQGCLERSFEAAAAWVEANEGSKRQAQGDSASASAAAVDMRTSGSTAVCCLVLQEGVVAAWVGDSRAVVGTASGDGGLQASALTQDHKPLGPEAERIRAAGGQVLRALGRTAAAIGPHRVCLPPHLVGPDGISLGLTVARAFGDLLLAPAGVIPTPELAVLPRAAPGDPSVLIVASDGLWEVVENQEAVELVAAAGSAEAGAQRLLEAAQQEWALRTGSLHCDDITVAVVLL